MQDRFAAFLSFTEKCNFVIPRFPQFEICSDFIFCMFWISNLIDFRLDDFRNSDKLRPMVSGGFSDSRFPRNSASGRLSDFACCCTCDLATGLSYPYPNSQTAHVKRLEAPATRSD